jgi:hypothetical protein
VFRHADEIDLPRNRAVVRIEGVVPPGAERDRAIRCGIVGRNLTERLSLCRAQPKMCAPGRIGSRQAGNRRNVVGRSLVGREGRFDLAVGPSACEVCSALAQDAGPGIGL